VIVSGEGVGMVRQCEDTNGVCWLETCTRWEPDNAYAFEVDTSAPRYPLPLRTMRGDFEVEPLDSSRSIVSIRFTFTARGGWATELPAGQERVRCLQRNVMPVGWFASGVGINQ